MHYISDIEQATTNCAASNDTSASSAISVNFSPRQLPPGNHNLADLMRERIQRREFFYGIELVARSGGGGQSALQLDYNSFGALLPLFTSVVWLWQDSENACVPVADAATIRFALQLRSRTVALPHFTCYRLDQQRLTDFLNLSFSNILVVRGDRVQADQEFAHASDLIEEIRRLRGNSIAIGVAAYPEGHSDAKSLEDDMDYLLKKVQAGADFIITQTCFNSTTLIGFIRKCRSKGITIPIMIGVYVPRTLHSLRRACELMRVRPPPPTAYLLQTDHSGGGDPKLFRAQAERHTVQIIKDVLSSDLDVFGVQFFTMNKLKSVQRVLEEFVIIKSVD